MVEMSPKGPCVDDFVPRGGSETKRWSNLKEMGPPRLGTVAHAFNTSMGRGVVSRRDLWEITVYRTVPATDS